MGISLLLRLAGRSLRKSALPLGFGFDFNEYSAAVVSDDDILHAMLVNARPACYVFLCPRIGAFNRDQFARLTLANLLL